MFIIIDTDLCLFDTFCNLYGLYIVKQVEKSFDITYKFSKRNDLPPYHYLLAFKKIILKNTSLR